MKRLKNISVSVFETLAPAWVVRARAKIKAPAMVKEIVSLPVTASYFVKVGSRNLPAITIGNDAVIIAELPNADERLMFGWLAKKKGTTPQHVKALCDAVVRWRYPHMAVGFLSLPWPKKERAFFHPQHKNFAQEDIKFSADLKEEICEVFRPRKGWTVVDIGAYFGHGALSFARAVGDSGSVLCIEASVDNCEILKETFKRNRLDNVSVRQHAISNIPDELIEFYLGKRQANAMDSSVAGEKVVTVQTTSLPKLIMEMEKAPDIISMTVNGAEVEAVQGLIGFNEEFLPRRMLMPGWYKKDGGYRYKLLDPMLRELGYKVATTTGGMVFAWQI